MLALAPHLVRQRPDRAARPGAPTTDAIAAMIFDRGVSFPWRTDDPRLAANGVIGDAHAASPELGQAIVDSVIEQTRGVLERLLENQRLCAVLESPMACDDARPVGIAHGAQHRGHARRQASRARTNRRSGNRRPRRPRRRS